MADYHTVYKGNEEDTTEWDDIHRKLGNLPPKVRFFLHATSASSLSFLFSSHQPTQASLLSTSFYPLTQKTKFICNLEQAPVWKPEPFAPKHDDRPAKDVSSIDAQPGTIDALEELEDDFADDRFLEEYRRRRLQELRRGAERPRFGGLTHIGGGQEFVDQVTLASDDAWVVCHLSKDSVAECRVLNQCLESLAKRYLHTKFVKIVSTDCIPGYPDGNLPTVLVYNKTKCLKTVVGLRAFGGLATSPEKVALALNELTGAKVCTDDDDVVEAIEEKKGSAGREERPSRGEEDEDEKESSDADY
jgi:hypothetical protein